MIDMGWLKEDEHKIGKEKKRVRAMIGLRWFKKRETQRRLDLKKFRICEMNDGQMVSKVTRNKVIWVLHSIKQRDINNRN